MLSLRSRNLALQLMVLVAVCAFLFFFGLGAFGLTGADEPRYAQIAREMLNRHDWIKPTLNGAPWLEKPVLVYWQAMISYKIFGVHDWAARVPSAVFASGLVLAIFFFMRRFRPGSQLDAALIAASSAAVVGFARGASTDMQMTAPFCVAMLAWWTWHEGGNKIWLAAFYALLGIGMLAKGPIAPAFAVLIVAAYASMRRDKAIFLRSLWWPGFLLFFAVALPWYIAVEIKVPEFFRVFFLQHNLERFATDRYRHAQPFWYYIPVFLLSILPWIVFSAPALAGAFRSVARVLSSGEIRRDGHANQGQDPEWLTPFLLLWIVIPVFFFSFSRSKLPGYILPAIPPAAILTASYLHRSEQALSRLKLILHAAICGALVAGALIAPWKMQKLSLPPTVRLQVAVAATLLGVSVILIVRRGGLKMLHFATLLPVIVAIGFLLRPAANVVDQIYSARAVDLELRNLGAEHQPIALFNVKREVEYGLNFYRNEPISRYDREGVPSTAHVAVAAEGSENGIRVQAAGRKVFFLGNFRLQHLEFFLVSSAR
ncbi:MAG TPA: glycosyltransferase family 39 protein [Candidatus Angelobacter sp.]|nr:glycosyltransferase family 39 protein [Candidatus Angelobacter sp.]